eukprot:7541055-Pyramimonas_sp.AAC.1
MADLVSRENNKNPLMIGLQLVPESILRPPGGFGHESYAFFCVDPNLTPLEAFRNKKCFHDGSCFKE